MSCACLVIFLDSCGNDDYISFCALILDTTPIARGEWAEKIASQLQLPIHNDGTQLGSRRSEKEHRDSDLNYLICS